MTRREFLKQTSRFLIAGLLAYLGNAFKIVDRVSTSPRVKTAKFFRQAEDLAG